MLVDLRYGSTKTGRLHILPQYREEGGGSYNAPAWQHKKANKMTFMISFGHYGGFYFHKDFSIRLCLGWVAFTILPADIDDIFDRLLPR